LGAVPARLKLTLVTLTLCAVAAVIGVLLAPRGSAELRRSADGWAGFRRPPGLAVPRFALRDQDGRRVTAASLRGHGPVVYAFVYSTCRDTCPAQVQTIRGALDELGHDVPVIGVSVDPANDTPLRAKSFMLKQSMTGRMRFLLGTRAQLAPVWRGFGIQPQTNRLEHSAHVVLADARGFQRVGFPFEQLTQQGVVDDLRRLGA
jgi:protein SCO1/2